MEVFFMRNILIDERAISLAQYIIDSKDTVRGAAKKFRNIKKYGTQRCIRTTSKDKSKFS
jgi:hypothetical protein